MMRHRALRDDGISTVVGAIVVLAILGTALLYVNAFHVPRQGAALELEGSSQTETSLIALARAMSDASPGAAAYDVPLQPPAGAQPLLAGVVAKPLRAAGTLALNETGAGVTVYVTIDAPAGGVPADDPVRADAGSGRMHVYLVGNKTSALPAGSLDASVGGMYSSAIERRLEAGLVIARTTDASLAVAGLDMAAQRGATTRVTWALPLLAGGAQDVGGGSVGEVALHPGPVSALGGGAAYGATIAIETTAVSAWESALSSALGSAATITSVETGAPDNGTVTAVLLPPVGTPATTRAVELELQMTRFEVTLGQRR